MKQSTYIAASAVLGLALGSLLAGTTHAAAVPESFVMSEGVITFSAPMFDIELDANGVVDKEASEHSISVDVMSDAGVAGCTYQVMEVVDGVRVPYSVAPLAMDFFRQDATMGTCSVTIRGANQYKTEDGQFSIEIQAIEGSSASAEPSASMVMGPFTLGEPMEMEHEEDHDEDEDEHELEHEDDDMNDDSVNQGRGAMMRSLRARVSRGRAAWKVEARAEAQDDMDDEMSDDGEEDLSTTTDRRARLLALQSRMKKLRALKEAHRARMSSDDSDDDMSEDDMMDESENDDSNRGVVRRTTRRTLRRVLSRRS